ncbi:unnamed protein product [Cylicocyclus nassatus]|uniref:Uncharacterized protein n=1 Tax=Cylicocyclus nassatus TaxID=53992 RepID=A0AA36GKI6_CYLNA|nr:unnamed protein product [Cylicocyclus nassatus]
MIKFTKCDVAASIIAVISLTISIVTLSIFPSFYSKMVVENLQMSQHEDGSPTFSTFMYANPPMKNIMKFFFFNITNPDEMIYFSAKPRLVETLAYTVIETEHKRYLKFSEDKEKLFYQNYKRFTISKEYSCQQCSWDDIVTIPNPTGIGAAGAIYDPQYAITPVAQKILAFGLLLVGEYPFISHTVKEVLFDGYNDALLDIGHSKFLAFISGIVNGGKSILPIPIPDMPLLGYFQGYNNSRDEEYWVKTGKSEINEIGNILTWGNHSLLPDYWWTTEYARSIRGSDSGSFCKMNLDKTDRLPFFQSYMCRSFTKIFLNETIVHNIPSYMFAVPYEDYDTTSDLNAGFRYRNVEKVNYYPDWPLCPGRNHSLCIDGQQLDCSLQENLCHACCNGSFVNGTYLLPPGMYPMVCYPGRLQPTPFAVMYSPPHFLYSPQTVIDSVVGLNPNNETHSPMIYSHEPYSGTITGVFYRLMVSMPTMPIKSTPQNAHLPKSIIPIFWQSSDAKLYDYTYRKLWLGFVFVPKFVMFLEYFLLTLGIFMLIFVATCQFLRRRSTKLITPKNIVAF